MMHNFFTNNWHRYLHIYCSSSYLTAVSTLDDDVTDKFNFQLQRLGFY